MFYITVWLDKNYTHKERYEATFFALLISGDLQIDLKTGETILFKKGDFISFSGWSV